MTANHPEDFTQVTHRDLRLGVRYQLLFQDDHREIRIQLPRLPKARLEARGRVAQTRARRR